MFTVIKGKWAWNDYIEDKDENGGFQTHCEFVSNGQVFTDLGFGYSSRWDYYSLDYWGEDTGNISVAASAQGDTTLRLELQEYRFMDFGESGCSISQDAYDFIVANAQPVYGIAEKLQYIAENTQRVYDKGYQVGNDDGYDEGLEIGYENGYSEGESKGYEDGKQDGKTEGYNQGKTEGLEEGYEKGKQAEYDAFWDEFQLKGQRLAYSACFGGSCWNAKTLRPKYDVLVLSAMYMFYRNDMGGDLVAHFESIGKRLAMEGESARNFNNAFDSSAFTRIGKMHSTTVNWYGTFNGCSKLVTIDEVGNPAENGETKFQSTTFSGCTALENITIVGWMTNSTSFSSSTKLTRASIESIVNHLSDNVSGKTLTLSKSAVDREFEGYHWVEELQDTSWGEGSISTEWKELIAPAVAAGWKISLV